jgi:outer membrane protein OmpA-like peptidoglycan-associated protein
MESSEALGAPVTHRVCGTRRRAFSSLQNWSAVRLGLPVSLLMVAAAFLFSHDRALAQFRPEQRPPVAQLSTPEPNQDTDRDSERQQAADERVAAFLIAEAREELELGELRSARRRLEVLVTRFASTAVAARARRLLEQLAMIDGFPIPPIPKGAPTASATPTAQPGGASIGGARPPGTSLLEADFSASGGDRLFFADGSDEVGGRGLRILREKASWLKRHGQVFVRIEGYADDLGGEAINGALALRRAETVRDTLVEAGVLVTRMHIAAFGREDRISPCDAPGCAAQNRRAVLVLTDARGARLTPQRAVGVEAGTGSGPARPGSALRRDR